MSDLMAINEADSLSLLENELQSLYNVHAALEAEAKALAEGDAPALEVALGLKEAAIGTYQSQRSLRTQAPACQDTDQTRSMLTELQNAAEACVSRNKSNGSLAFRLTEATQAALNILRGTESTGQLYSYAGMERASHTSSRSLGRA